MNNLYKLFIINILHLVTAFSIAQTNCSNIILEDNFTTISNWLSQGDGKVNIKNGKCNFDSVYCGSYNRIYKNLNTTLPDSYWKAECDFSILSPNPTGNGTAEVVLALTAGNLPFMAYDSFQNFMETNQDGIAIVVTSGSHTNSDINSWFFLIEGKKNNVRFFNTDSSIFADSSIDNYYLRLERIGKNLTQLSVFSDSLHINHLPRSPITFSIDSTISGLNTVQHGTATPGNKARFINASVDNDKICSENYESISPLDFLKTQNTILSNIYPNPFSDQLIVSFTLPETKKITIELLDLHGRIVYNSQSTNFVKGENMVTINSDNFSEGIYLSKLTTDSTTLCHKVVKY